MTLCSADLWLALPGNHNHSSSQFINPSGSHEETFSLACSRSSEDEELGVSIQQKRCHGDEQETKGFQNMVRPDAAKHMIQKFLSPVPSKETLLSQNAKELDALIES